MFGCVATTSVHAAGGPPFDAIASEPTAQTALEAIIEKLEAAIPPLTPQQQQYVSDEEAFAHRKVPAGTPIPKATQERFMSYMNSREKWISEARVHLEQIRHDLKGVRSLASLSGRFAFWSDIAMQMSNSGDLAADLSMLHRLGVVNTEQFGIEQGVNWLAGQSEGRVQLLWPFLAERMWNTWLYDDLAKATGVPPAQRGPILRAHDFYCTAHPCDH